MTSGLEVSGAPVVFCQHRGTKVTKDIGFEPYVFVPYVSLAAESSLNGGLLLLKWLIPRSASLNCHSCGYVAPLLTTRMFSGFTS